MWNCETTEAWLYSRGIKGVDSPGTDAQRELNKGQTTATLERGIERRWEEPRALSLHVCRWCPLRG
jgi:hypothetical protein